MNVPGPTIECELFPLFGDCEGRMTLQHIISRAKTQGSRGLREATERPELLAWVCLKCNSGTKRADSKAARRFLLHKRAKEYGIDHLKAVISALPAKIPMSYDELVGAMPWAGLKS